MNKKTLIAAGLGLVLVAALAIGALAYGPQLHATTAAGVAPGQYHDRMEQALENGTYSDLVALRAESGMPMMPWVTDEASFQQAQAQYRQGGYGPGYGYGMMGGGFGGGYGPRGGSSSGFGCPMRAGGDAS